MIDDTALEQTLPLNSVARNSTWIYPALTPPRFPGAPSIIEDKRTIEPPDFSRLPERADIILELYGGACTLRLDGLSHRIYTARFQFVSFSSEDEARHAFVDLWDTIRPLNSVKDVDEAVERWRERRSANQ